MTKNNSERKISGEISARKNSATSAENSATSAKKGARFALVGLANTLLDFALMNIFAHFLPWAWPNILSTGIAMLSSFYFNKKWTFGSRDKSRRELRREILLFFAFTAAGIWLIQTPLMYWIASWGFLHQIFAGVLPQISTNFLVANFAKAAASVASLTWNFVTYQKFVFRNSATADEGAEIDGI